MAEKKQIDPNLLLIGGGALLFYFGILDPVLKAIGLKDDAEDRERDGALNTLESKSGWYTQTYYKYAGKTGYLFLTQKAADFYADEINNSLHWYNDDEERIYKVFRSLSSHLQLSQVVLSYGNKHKADLYTTLKDWLNDSEMFVIAGIVNKYPEVTKP